MDFPVDFSQGISFAMYLLFTVKIAGVTLYDMMRFLIIFSFVVSLFWLIVQEWGRR